MLDLEKLIKNEMNLFGIQKMEDRREKENTHVVEHQDKGGLFEERREMKPEWEPRKFQKESRVLAWALSLGQEHPDSGFFRGGECKKCSGCSDEFNFLHYTSEKNAYCVRCYLDGFCDVVEDNTIILVILRRTGRILIEIHNPNQ